MAYVKGKIGERLDLLKRTQKFLSLKQELCSIT